MRSRIVLSFLLTFALITGVQAQSISVSLIGGVNFANVKFDPKQEIPRETRTGFIAGTLVEAGISKSISIVSGLDYSSKGYEVNSGSITGKIKLSYMEFPALLKYKIKGMSVSPYAVAGPVLGLVLKAKGDIDSGSSNSETDIKKDVKTLDFGFLFGAGMDFKISPSMGFFIQGGYQLGLLNFNNVANSSLEVKNYLIQVSGGIKFDLK